MVTALLLLIAGVECNPGPPAVDRCNKIVFSSLNIHSAVNRAALVHMIIADKSVDLLALQETWIDADDPSAIQADLTPTGYGVLHVHRPSSKESRRGHGAEANRLNRGGGLAIVYRQELNAKAHRLQPVMKPSTFEYQFVVLKTNSSTSIIINIYRPPPPWIASQPFFDELADLVSVLLTS